MKPQEQYRIIRDPNNLDEIKIPTMPILIVFDNGFIGEASTIRGAVALIVGKEYFDAEDALDEWYYRVEASRKEAMKATMRDIYAVTYDERKGIIEYNYAAAPQDPDYDIEVQTPPIKVRVENERLFIYSLIKIGAITILERENSFLLRLNNKWIEDGPKQCCGKCIYKDNTTQEFICPVYNEVHKEDEGTDCSSFSIREGSLYTTDKKDYIDISLETDLDELIDYMGQSWIIKE